MSWEKSFGNANKYGINADGTFKNSRSDPRSENFAGTSDERIKSLILRGFGDDSIEYWTVYNYAKQNKTRFINPLSKSSQDLAKRGVTSSLMPNVIDFSPAVFVPTERTDVFDLAVTKGKGKPFDEMTLERIEKQEEVFTDSISKPIIVTSALIPLAIIAFLVLKK